MLIRPLTVELQKKAENELNEVSKRLTEDVNYINEWLKKQHHLNVRNDDQWLVSFLRGCKFSLQRTKENIDYFYTMRTLLPEYFSKRDPFSTEIQEVLNAGAVVVLPRTKEITGPKIILVRWEVCDPDKISAQTLMKTFFMIMDILMNEDDNCVVSGVCVWSDFIGLSLNYLLQFTPAFLKKSILCVENAYPVRVKGVYCTNSSSAVEAVFNLAKTFTSKKLRERMNLYSVINTCKVYKDIPKTIMPKEFGGDGESLDVLTSQWKKKVESYKDWFLEDTKYSSNEKLRNGFPKTTADIFGVEGSFRRLTID